MLCCRLFVLVLLVLCTACVTCSILFPQFRAIELSTSTEEGNQTHSVYFWFNETVEKISGTTYVSRTYSRDADCSLRRTLFVVQAILSVVAAGLGGLATICTAFWVPISRQYFFGGVACVLSFLAFVACAVTVILSIFGYRVRYCSAASSLEGASYKIVEGFFLIAAAAGGFLLMCFWQMIVAFGSFCCNCGV